MSNVILIKDKYKIEHILDKHLVVIAVGDDNLLKTIEGDCQQNYKIYLNCTKFKEGMFITPMQGDTKEVVFSIHTKGGSPKTSKFLMNKVQEELRQYDDLVKYLCELREKIKVMDNKNEIMEFVSQDDFEFFFEMGVHEIILNMFYGGNLVDNSDEAK